MGEVCLSHSVLSFDIFPAIRKPPLLKCESQLLPVFCNPRWGQSRDYWSWITMSQKNQESQSFTSFWRLLLKKVAHGVKIILQDFIVRYPTHLFKDWNLWWSSCVVWIFIKGLSPVSGILRFPWRWRVYSAGGGEWDGNRINRGPKWSGQTRSGWVGAGVLMSICWHF